MRRNLVVTAILSSAALAFGPCWADDSVNFQTYPSQSQIEDLESGFGIAPPGLARPLAPLAPELIMHFEDWRSTPYPDPSGYCTIGYGHLIAKGDCTTINTARYPRPLTRDEGAQIFEEDTRSARIAIQRLVTVELNNDQFGALTSFTYNIGKSGLAKSDLLKLINAKNWSGASAKFRSYVASKKITLAGLVKRRDCEATLFAGALKPDANGRFTRSSCMSGPVGGLLDVLTN